MDQRETRLKRLRMRCWRRGTREMDLILGPFADTEIDRLSDAELDDFERMIAQNDQDLYPWVTARLRGGTAGPAEHAVMLDRVAAHAAGRLHHVRGA